MSVCRLCQGSLTQVEAVHGVLRLPPLALPPGGERFSILRTVQETLARARSCRHPSTRDCHNTHLLTSNDQDLHKLTISVGGEGSQQTASCLNSVSFGVF